MLISSIPLFIFLFHPSYNFVLSNLELILYIYIFRKIIPKIIKIVAKLRLVETVHNNRSIHEKSKRNGIIARDYLRKRGKRKRKGREKGKITMPLISFNEKDRETIVTGAIGQRWYVRGRSASKVNAKREGVLLLS